MIAHKSRGFEHPLRELVWGVEGHRVFVDDGTGWWGEEERNQKVMIETLDVDIIRAEMRRAALERDPAAIGHTERRSRTMGGREVFSGTRTPVEAVLSYLRRGLDDERILEAFPHLASPDIERARELLAAS